MLVAGVWRGDIRLRFFRSEAEYRFLHMTFHVGRNFCGFRLGSRGRFPNPACFSPGGRIFRAGMANFMADDKNDPR
jgi:hypothetical protein